MVIFQLLLKYDWVCDKSHCNGMPATITLNGVFTISIKATLNVPTESSTNVKCWEILFHQKTQSVMCTCVFSDKAEKILGRQGQNH